MLWRILIGIAIGLFVSWGILVVVLLRVRPKGSLLQEALRLLPDTLRLPRGCYSPIWRCPLISSRTSFPSSATPTTPSSFAGSCVRWSAARESKPFVSSGRERRMGSRCFGA